MSPRGKPVVVSCLGAVRASVDGATVRLTPEQEVTVAALVAAGPGGLSKERLADQLFPAPADGAQLQASIMRARRLAEKLATKTGPALETGASKICIRPDRAEVDLWQFLDGLESDSPDRVRESLLSWAEPFADVAELPDLAVLEIEHARTLFLDHLASFMSLVTPQFGSDVIQVAKSALDANPFNEELAGGTAVALYQCHRQREALAVIRACRTALRNESGLSPSPMLNRLELTILTHEHPPKLGVDQPQPLRGRPPQSDRGVDLAPHERFVGRRRVLDLLAERVDTLPTHPKRKPAPILLLEAPAGYGKTATVDRLMASIADRSLPVRRGQVRVADIDAAGRWIGTDEVYAAFLDALPELEPHVDALVSDPDHERARLHFWERCQSLLAELVVEGPAIMVLEDMHDADSQTCALLRYLASGNRPANLMLVVTARPQDGPTRTWHRLADELVAEGVVERVDIPPLTLGELEELVAADHPEAPPAVRQRFAIKLAELSQGQALVASILSRDSEGLLDPSRLPEGVSPESRLARHLDNKVPDQELAQLLSVGALISGTGLQFDVGLLAQALAMSPEQALGLLAMAQSASICRPVDGQTWRFDHLLTVGHFAAKLELVKPVIYARLAQLAPRTSGNVVRFVRGARDSLDWATAVEILDSATAELQARLAFSEAAGALEHLLALLVQQRSDPTGSSESDDLSPSLERRRLRTLLALAACVSRAGDPSQAADYRRAAYDLARKLDDVDAMYHAAVAGLPAGEYVGGEEDRLSMLSSIDPTQLKIASRVRCSFWRLRLARLSSDRATAEQVLTTISSDWKAEDPEGWDMLAVERLSFESAGPEATRIYEPLLRMVDRTENEPFRASVLHRAVVAGLSEQQPEVIDLYHRAAVEAAVFGSPRTRWGLAVLGGALNQVGVDSVSTTYDQARLAGLELGVLDVYDAWMVQVWADLWFGDRLAEALAVLDARRDEIAHNVAWEAATALAAATAGPEQRAVACASRVIEDLRRTPAGTWSQAAACLLVDATTRLKRYDLADAGLELLRPLTGRSLVLGIGSAHLGPIDRYIGLAIRDRSASESAYTLRSAYRQAHHGGLAVWCEKIESDLIRLGL